MTGHSIFRSLDLSKPPSQQRGNTPLNCYDGSQQHTFPRYEQFCQAVSRTPDPESAMVESGMHGKPERGWSLLKDQAVAARLAFLGVNVTALLERSPLQKKEAEASPDSAEEPDENPVNVKPLTRSDIIEDMERCLANTDSQRLEGRERLAYLEKLARMKGFEGQELGDRPPEPCHMARYITQWAGHAGKACGEHFPGGELMLFNDVMDFAGWDKNDLQRLSREYEEEMAGKAKDRAGEQGG